MQAEAMETLLREIMLACLFYSMLHLKEKTWVSRDNFGIHLSGSKYYSTKVVSFVKVFIMWWASSKLSCMWTYLVCLTCQHRGHFFMERVHSYRSKFFPLRGCSVYEGLVNRKSQVVSLEQTGRQTWRYPFTFNCLLWTLYVYFSLFLVLERTWADGGACYGFVSSSLQGNLLWE